MNIFSSQVLRNRKVFLSFVIGMSSILVSHAKGSNLFPGPIPTLIDQYTTSDLVIFAEILKTDSTRTEQVSQLKIESTIKADKRKVPKEINVVIQFGSHWPRLFKAKTKTITFLRFDKELKQYVPVYSSSGLDIEAKPVSEFYIKQFAKLPKILAIKDKRKQLMEKVQWYFELTLFPPARWHGGFGISALWSRALKAKLLKDEEKESEAKLLTKFQKERICKTLAKETPDASATILIEILEDYPSSDLNYFLIQSIKRSMMFEKAVPIFSTSVPTTAYEVLPKRLGFEVDAQLQKKYDEFQMTRRAYNKEFRRDKTKYSEEEKAAVRRQVINRWRIFATGFLNHPAVVNAYKNSVSR